jgi:hypothetical protein
MSRIQKLFALDKADKEKLKKDKNAKVIEISEKTFGGKTWYKRKEVMNKRQFEARKRKYRAKEYAETTGEEADWKKGKLSEYYD